MHMKELRCPKCGSVIKVDDADYSDIVSQVKNAEFTKEVNKRMEELEKQHLAEQEAAALKTENLFKDQLSEKDISLSKKDKEIAELKAKLEGADNASKLQLASELAKKEEQIAALKTQVSQNDNALKIAILEERNKNNETLQDKEQEISNLKVQVELAKKEATIKESNLKEEFNTRLKLKQEEVDHYKELKAMMSTKMIGESLEVHCSNEFNKVRTMMFPNAYFGKDNDASGGSKGDFIFRDTQDGVEYISIMFEMKNEMETTATKHKNEDFLAKLDKDRKDKGCEYAVLVSLLEPDNELYNEGIVDVSYQYPKMYVIRPQFFMALISLLSQASKKGVQYMKELEQARQQSIDVTNFETKVNAFRDKFAGHYQKASEKFNKAVEEIDKTIKSLQKMKENLLSSENYLRLANNDTEDLSIKKLTRANPTMKQMFEEARLSSSLGSE